MAHLINGSKITQGAILYGVDWGLEPNPLSIVLTNECDFVNGNASFVIVAALVAAKETITESEDYKKQNSGHYKRKDWQEQMGCLAKIP